MNSARHAARIVLAFGVSVFAVACGPTTPEGETRPMLREGRAGIVVLEGTEAFSDGEWRKHGDFIFRDDRGSEIARGSYIDGLEEGAWSQTLEDGSRAQGQMSKGSKTGEWRYLHANGTAQDVGHYDRGLRTGVWLSFRSDGTKLREGVYENGELKGEATFYLPDGKTVDRARSEGRAKR